MAVLGQSTPEAPDLLPSLTFAEAAPIWYEAHARRVALQTQRDYRACIHALQPFFSQLRLDAIRIQHFEKYQALRSEGSGGLRAAGPSRVNHEMNTLSQILTQADLWAPIARRYQPLRLPRSKVGCALSPEDEERLFRVASSNPRWKVAYLCSVLSANTTAGPGEIRHLRIRDVDLLAKPQPTIHIVEGVKNDYRRRKIPLNGRAASAITQLLDRARARGATRPEHYLLPLRCPKGGFDPTKPTTTWRGAWDKLRKAAGLPNLRRYDLRHHAITKLAENERVSERTLIDIAGHVDPQMLQVYSHIRIKSRVDAVNALNEGSIDAGSNAPPQSAPERACSIPIPASSEKSEAMCESPGAAAGLKAQLYWSSLSAEEKAVLDAMYEHCGEGSIVLASLNRIAKYSKLSRKTVQRVLHGPETRPQPGERLLARVLGHLREEREYVSGALRFRDAGQQAAAAIAERSVNELRRLRSKKRGLIARGIVLELAKANPRKSRPATYRINAEALVEDPKMEPYKTNDQSLVAERSAQSSQPELPPGAPPGALVASPRPGAAVRVAAMP